MELSESIESLNNQLIDLFGLETNANMAMFRIVYSDNQYEKRRVDYYNGVRLLIPEVLEVPKYSWIKQRWVLEQLVIVPEMNMLELPCNVLSYEPLWIFETQRGEYLPPRIDAAKLIIDTMYAALGKTSLVKYVDSEENTTVEGRDARINQLQSELFGNETAATDALAYGTGVSVPSNYRSES